MMMDLQLIIDFIDECVILAKPNPYWMIFNISTKKFIKQWYKIHNEIVFYEIIPKDIFDIILFKAAKELGSSSTEFNLIKSKIHSYKRKSS